MSTIERHAPGLMSKWLVVAVALGALAGPMLVLLATALSPKIAAAAMIGLIVVGAAILFPDFAFLRFYHIISMLQHFRVFCMLQGNLRHVDGSLGVRDHAFDVVHIGIPGKRCHHVLHHAVHHGRK